MKITDIQADNVLAIKSINLKLRTAVSLICGRNGSLKSSIFDVVSMAVANEPMRAVIHKKDYGMLVHDGAKAGGGLVVMDGDADNAYSFNLPKGEFTGPAVTDAMRVALNGQNFAKMDAKQRLVFLRTLTKIRPTKEVILPMLLDAAGAPHDKIADIMKLLPMKEWAAIDEMAPNMQTGYAEKVEEVTAQLRAGFSSAEEYAKERALDAKRLWCTTTGKKSYGKDVAEAWEAELPELPTGDAAALKQQIADQDAAISTATQSLGAIKQAAAQAAADAEQRAKLAEAPAKVKSIQEQLPLAEKELAEYLPKVEALRERAKGVARVGLVHDQARFIAALVPSEADVAVSQAKLVASYKKEHGALTAAGEVDATAQAELPAHENGLKVLQNRVANLKRDLDSAVQAKGQYDALAPAEKAEDVTAELAEVQTLLENAKVEKQRLMNLVLDIEAKLKNRAEAAQKNVDAKKHHTDVAQWLLIAEQLAPTGIPRTLLVAALKPVNEMLMQAHMDTDWPLVVIDEDCEIIVGGRPRGLQSESYQWRADAHIAQMVATISGIKIMMLDRFDVLDLPGRGELFTWLDTLVEMGDIDSAMLFGTLKALPTSGLPASFTSYWVADGGVQQVAEPEPEAVAEAEAA